jgi:hypothetical protein
VHSFTIVGLTVGRWGVNYVCMQVFFDKTAPVAKTSWADVPTNQRNLCYKNYNANFKIIIGILNKKES